MRKISSRFSELVVKTASIRTIIVLLLFVGILSGCQIVEGPGGMATITGKVYATEYDASLTTELGAYYAPEENVYIVYGDHEVFDDNVDTHHDGTFRFEFLRKGTYTVFVYSKDTLLLDPLIEQPIIRTVEITAKSQTVDLGDLNIIK